MNIQDPQIAKAHAFVAEYTRNHPEMTLTDIAARFQLSTAWLHKILRAHKVRRQSHPYCTLADRMKTNPELFETEEVK